MFWRKKERAPEEGMDDLVDILVQASRATDDEVDAAASSPFLYSRVRASIEARRPGYNTESGAWRGLLSAARLAVPAMAALSIIAACLPWTIQQMSRMSPPGARPQAEVPASGPPVRQPQPGPGPNVTSLSNATCSLSNSQECSISNNAMLATIFADENQETRR